MSVALDMTAGWRAELEMSFSRRGGKTVMEGLRHLGPLRVQRPFYPEAGSCHVYLLHPPGGVVGGDGLAIDVSVHSAAHALVTTPGASKFYRSAGATARVEQTLRLASQASLEWFPQENIFFPGARVKLKTRIDLEPEARFIGWEIQCLGRPTIGERFEQGRMDAAFQLYRQGRPVLLERQRIDARQQLDAAAGLRGHPMNALFIATPCQSEHVALAREIVARLEPDFPVGITLIDDVLVLRALGESTEQLQGLMIPVWQGLRPRLLGKEAVPPRIWAT